MAWFSASKLLVRVLRVGLSLALRSHRFVQRPCCDIVCFGSDPHHHYVVASAFLLELLNHSGSDPATTLLREDGDLVQVDHVLIPIDARNPVGEQESHRLSVHRGNVEVVLVSREQVPHVLCACVLAAALFSRLQLVNRLYRCSFVASSESADFHHLLSPNNLLSGKSAVEPVN